MVFFQNSIWVPLWVHIFLQEFWTRISVGKADHFSFYKSNTYIIKSHLILNECVLFLEFQVFARFMVMLNLFLPFFSILFILNASKAPVLNICLGKGYLNFFSTNAKLCSWENPYTNGVCWVWLIILSIGNLKFQINILERINVYRKVASIKA